MANVALISRSFVLGNADRNAIAPKTVTVDAIAFVLCHVTARTLRLDLYLLGILVLDRM